MISAGDEIYQDDLSGRYDLYDGYEGHVYYHAPIAHVNTTPHDGVWGYAPQPGASVSVTVTNGGGVKATTTVNASDTDGRFEAFYDGSVDIAPGDTDRKTNTTSADAAPPLSARAERRAGAQDADRPLSPPQLQAMRRLITGAESRHTPFVAPQPGGRGLAAPCNVSGLIGSDTTWGPGYCDPYIVTGSIIVQSGVTLTIEPGTTVKFDSLKALTVQGTLVARGSEANPILFTSSAAGPAKGDWGYIYFTDSSTDATFDGDGNYTSGPVIQYALVEYAGGAAVSENGAIRIDASSPYIDHNIIRDNKADGVHVWNGVGLRITNNSVTDNGIAASANASGIYISDSTASTTTISGNTITGNTASYGGGLSLSSCYHTFTINNNTISGNTASASGGGIYLKGCYFTFTITNNTISGNTASVSGGGIAFLKYFYYATTNDQNTYTINGNTITDNTASSDGGGIYVSSHNNTSTINDNVITLNIASGSGGGIYTLDSGTLSNNAISGNTASANGGGIYVSYNNTKTISGNSITNNAAVQVNRGGGIYVCAGCLPTISDNDLYDNLTGSPTTTANDLYNGNPSGNPDVNAENNYWGTTDPAVIEEHVWHFVDDSALGIVDYVPYCESSCWDPGPAVDITASLAFDGLRGQAVPYALITATLKDGGGAFKGYAVARADGTGWFGGIGWSGWTYFYNQGRMVDIAPGDQIDFNVNGVLTTIDLGDITGTLDPNTDTLTGNIGGSVAYPLAATLATHGLEIPFTVNAPGDFAYDFAALTDIRQDDDVDVTYQAAPGFTISNWIVPRDGYTVYVNWDELWGYTTPGAEVAVTIRDGGGAVKDSGTATAFSLLGYWDYLAGADILPGDTVEVQVGGGTYTSTVANITTSFDLANDLVSGTGPAGSEIFLMTCQQEGVECHWYEAEAATDGSGNYSSALFGSGPLDLDRASWVYAGHSDTPRADTTYYGAPPLARVNITYNNVAGMAEAGATVTATLHDSGGAFKDEANAVAEPWSYYALYFDADVIPGDSVEVTGGGVNTTVVVQNLTAFADANADTVSGEAPVSAPMYLYGRRWPGRYFGERFTAGADGTYTYALGGRLDLLNGYNGHTYYAQADDHRAFYHWYAPVVHVNQTHSGVWGYAPRPGDTVNVTVRDSGGGVKAERSVAASGQDGYFRTFYDGSVRIVSGDTVEVATDSWATVVNVVDLQATLDRDTDVASGSGPADSVIHVQTENYGYADLWVPSDASGNWMADLSGMADLESNAWVRVAYEDAAGNEVYTYHIVPYVRVNQTHDWVQGNVQPNVPVTATLLAPDSTVRGVGTTWSGDDGCFHTDFWDEWDDRADVQTNDTVQVEAGDSFFDVFVIPMTGDVDPAADTVCGQMFDGDFPAPFFVDIWGTGGDTHREGTTDEFGNYCADYSGSLDIHDGHDAFIVYTNPDGNQVGIVRSYLRMGVGITGDWLDITTAPGLDITATLWSAGYGEVKDTQYRTANDDGSTWLGFDADVQPGDIVEVEADGRLVSLDVVNLSASGDPDTDTVSGTAPPDSYVEAEVWGHGDDHWDDTTSDEFGDWDIYFGDEYDVQPNDRGQAWWTHDDGHWFQIDFAIPYVEVHFRNYDWVQGRVAPNAWVDITLRDSLSEVKGAYSNWARGDGWFGGWCVLDDYGNCVDIAPGDTVEVVYDGSDPIIVPVIEITGIVDAAANTISGQILADDLPTEAWTDIWWTREGAGQSFTTDEFGNYFVDYSPYDVLPGHWVNIWYTNPDGHQLGAIFSELRLEVDVSHDNVNGLTELGRDVTMTLRAADGSIKDEATDTANYEGYFGAGFSEDIAPGDTVEAATNPETSVFIEDVTIDVDVDADTVCGTAPPDAWLHVGVHGGPWWDLAADEFGDYCADFS
ncbi:MAG: right-handed parallel beta-helix repeat-containing protein, partial [Chloroflexi bacterium]|nr:right-handed parallel beta-helix repeat-containing protein [Chloroflexota bacterium]